MMFMAIFVVYFKHHMRHIIMLYGKNVVLFISFKLDGMKTTTML